MIRFLPIILEGGNPALTWVRNANVNKENVTILIFNYMDYYRVNNKTFVTVCMSLNISLFLLKKHAK